MNRVVVHLALALLGIAPGLQGAQAPGATQRIDGRRLRIGTDSFAVYLLRGRDTTRIGSVADELRSDGTRLTRLYTQDDSIFGGMTDTIVSHLPELRPMEFRSHSPYGIVQLTFSSTAVVGWTRTPKVDSAFIYRDLDHLVYDPASFDLIARASDLNDSLQVRSSTFDYTTNSLDGFDGRVAGSAMVQGRPSWVFEGNNGRVIVTFWIDKATRALRRSVMQFRPDISLMLVAIPN